MMHRGAWFSEARFGMFIHWGLYSLAAGHWEGRRIQHPYAEWLQASERIPRSQYRALAKDFNPVDFSAEAWVHELCEAGMKYLVITAKHHDGFALWPSKVSAFNVAEATPFKRDILGELVSACRARGIRIGFYYSHWQDWEGTGGDICSVHMENEEYQHPSQEVFEDYWQNKCLAQIRELIECYDPDLFWFDSWDDYQGKGRDFTSAYLTSERQEELISLIRELSDKCLINSRIHYEDPSERVDFLSMMDNVFPDQGFDKPWETSGTLNDTWGYHLTDFDWKPSSQLIQLLINNASLGGNYQLNVGPMGNGKFQDAAIRRLREIGAWLSIHGDAIYGTQASPIGKGSWGRATTKALSEQVTALYLHLQSFTPGTSLHLESVRASACRGRVLETDQAVQTTLTEQGLFVDLPDGLRGEGLPVVELRLDTAEFRELDASKQLQRWVPGEAS